MTSLTSFNSLNYNFVLAFRCVLHAYCRCAHAYVYMCMCVPACVIYTYRLLKGSPPKKSIYICMYLMVNIIGLYKDSALRSYGPGVLPCLLVLYSIIYKPGVAHCSASLVYSKARTFSLDYSLCTCMRPIILFQRPPKLYIPGSHECIGNCFFRW